MPSQPCLRKHTAAEKLRVLDAHREGRADWLTFAKQNGISRSAAYRTITTGRVEDLPRGGARGAVVKVTPEMKEKLKEYINEDCTLPLKNLRTMLAFDMNVVVSTSTISRHLLGMLYTVKQTRIEPMTCNNEVNKTKRQAFAVALKKHQMDGDCIVYFDETNYNAYCKRGQGRAKRGERATVVLPPSKGANLQVQCAVSSDMGVVLYKLERGSIRMEQNAAFIDEIYDTVKASAVFQNNFSGKNIVVVLDNAPAHRQTEARVKQQGDLVLLRLASYSPMCNPIEGCFSVMNVHIKAYLALYRGEICDRTEMTDDSGIPLTIKEKSMRFLERAAKSTIKYITPTIVRKMELHARDSVNAAEEMKNMTYGA